MKTSFPSWPKRHFVQVLPILILIAIVGSIQAAFAAVSPPVLLSNATSTRAIALESVTQRPEPFKLTASAPFSTDTRTRVELFVMNLDLLAGEGANSLTADAEDAAKARYPLLVEYVGQVPGFEGIYMVIVRLNDSMTSNLGDVLVRLNLHGVASNRVRIAIGTIGGGPADDAGAVPTPAPATPPSPPTPLTISQYRSQFTNPALAAGPDGIRFLEQVTWGPTSADLAHLRSIGMQAYLDEQFNAADSNYPLLTLYPITPPASCTGTCLRDNYTMYPLQIRFFQNALTGPDQLRQRVAFALHQLIPVSGRELNNSPSWVTPYLRIMDAQAFGNFRNVLSDITLNPAMGFYLDMAGNSKASPNENYSREIMQLFSTGPDLLNPDGTPVLDAQGNRVASYDNATITNLARIFTGWNLTTTNNSVDGSLVPDYITPMPLVNNTNTYDVASKTLAPMSNTVFPACTNCTNTANFKAYKANELSMAIDVLFNHQNTGPYLCRELIHQLVTSNPSPAYIGRCSAAFANNGSGVRGDMKAVIAAIILDPEARGDVKTDPAYGHLREPVLFINNLLRGFNATSDFNIAGSLRGSFSYTNDMDQDLFSPPTVFSYYAADYGLPGTNLFGPEFGVLSTSTSLKRANFVDTLFLANNGNGIPPGTDRPAGTQVNYASYQALAGNPAALVDALDTFLMHNTMSATMKNNVIQTVTNVTNADAAIRTRTAIYLIATSSQYQVEK
ncbi:MAG TPA: DUF1800 family protein [Pyrinomonadaceae bacterium]|nr:DUF1800 family protein [Pyrinomonadaceae bacterium]